MRVRLSISLIGYILDLMCELVREFNALCDDLAMTLDDHREPSQIDVLELSDRDLGALELWRVRMRTRERLGEAHGVSLQGVIRALSLTLRQREGVDTTVLSLLVAYYAQLDMASLQNTMVEEDLAMMVRGATALANKVCGEASEGEETLQKDVDTFVEIVHFFSASELVLISDHSIYLTEMMFAALRPLSGVAHSMRQAAMSSLINACVSFLILVYQNSESSVNYLRREVLERALAAYHTPLGKMCVMLHMHHLSHLYFAFWQIQAEEVGSKCAPLLPNEGDAYRTILDAKEDAVPLFHFASGGSTASALASMSTQEVQALGAQLQANGRAVLLRIRAEMTQLLTRLFGIVDPLLRGDSSGEKTDKGDRAEAAKWILSRLIEDAVTGSMMAAWPVATLFLDSVAVHCVTFWLLDLAMSISLTEHF